MGGLIKINYSTSTKTFFTSNSIAEHSMKPLCKKTCSN